MKNYILVATALFAVSCASQKKSETVVEKKAEATAATTKTDKTTPNQKVAKASSSEATAAEYVCTYGDVRRELKNVQTAEGCRVEYTKDGAVQEIATGAANSQFCVDVIERVKSNLTTAGYTCK